MPKIKQGQSQSNNSKEGGAAFGRPTSIAIVLQALALLFIFGIGPSYYYWLWPHDFFVGFGLPFILGSQFFRFPCSHLSCAGLVPRLTISRFPGRCPSSRPNLCPSRFAKVYNDMSCAGLVSRLTILQCPGLCPGLSGRVFMIVTCPPPALCPG